MKVAVLGSGNGGCAVAFDCSLHGHDVFLFDFPNYGENISAITQAGGIESKGVLSGFSPVYYSGFDLQNVLDEAEVIFVVGPSYSIPPFAKACKPFLKEGQTVIVCPGSCGGSIAFKNILGIDFDSHKVLLAETSTLPYAVRLKEPGKIQIFNKLQGGIFLAGLPSSQGVVILQKIQDVYPAISLAQNVMQTFLQNGNPVIHPAVILMNGALIERTQGDLLFYEEGVTPVVGRVIKAVDQERIAIGKALGLEIIPDPVLGCMQGYQDENNYDTSYNRAKGFKGILAPSTLRNRYLTEDVAHSMLLMRSLAQMVGVKTPTMDAIITISSIVLEDDILSKEPDELTSIGLKDMSLTTFLKVINQ